MKGIQLILGLGVFIFLQSCNLLDRKIDVGQAKQLVNLTANDLDNFTYFRQQLLLDSAAIREAYYKVTSPYNRTGWMSTYSDELYQIDSSKYAKLYLKLKGKLEDFIAIDTSGNVRFTLKENIQINTGNYNETYRHDLINADYSDPINVETMFVDSIINKEWRYISYKVLTGH